MSDWGITTKVPAEVVLAEGIVARGRPAPVRAADVSARARDAARDAQPGGRLLRAHAGWRGHVRPQGAGGGGVLPEPVAADGSRPADRRAAHRAGGGDAGRARSTAGGLASSCRRPAAGRSTTSTAPAPSSRSAPTTSAGTSTSRASGSRGPSTETACGPARSPDPGLVRAARGRAAARRRQAGDARRQRRRRGALTRDPLTDAQILDAGARGRRRRLGRAPRRRRGREPSLPLAERAGDGGAHAGRRWPGRSRSARRRPAAGARAGGAAGGRSAAELAEARAAHGGAVPAAGRRRRLRPPPPHAASRRCSGGTASWSAQDRPPITAERLETMLVSIMTPARDRRVPRDGRHRLGLRDRGPGPLPLQRRPGPPRADGGVPGHPDQRPHRRRDGPEPRGPEPLLPHQGAGRRHRARPARARAPRSPRWWT